MRIFAIRHKLFRTFSAALLLSVTSAQNQAGAQEANLTYPSSAVIEPTALDENRRKLMRSLVMLPAKDKERPKIKEALCPQTVVKPDPNEPIRAALAVTDSDMSVEVHFEKNGTGKPTEAKEFSVFLEFSEKEVLIRPSLPRYASDGEGLLVPYPYLQTRFLWVEGKQGSDLLYLIPEVDECGVQSVVICPRTYVPRTTLATTGYSPTSARYFVSAKADGLFAVNPGETGRIQASILGTKGMELPRKWSKEDRSTTPSATIKFSTPRAINDKPPAFIPSTMPILGAIEARLDFGKESPLKMSRNRVTIEVTPFELDEPQKTVIRGAQLNIEIGACYMVSKWRENYM